MHIPNTYISDRLFLWLGVLAALFAIFMHIGIATTDVTRKEWAAPASYVKKHFQPGDVIGVLPQWALQGAEPFRKHPILYREDFSTTDLTRYKRLWLVTAPRLGKWWFRKAFQTQLHTLRKLYWHKEVRHFGPLELHLFQLPAPIPRLYNFGTRKRLRQAEVWYAPPEKPIPGCSTHGNIQWMKRWQPKPGWWHGVGGDFFGRLRQEIGDSPKECLWAVSRTCQVLHVRYRLVPLEGTLSLGHGFGTAAPGKITGTLPPSGPDVKLSLWIENQKVRDFVVSQKHVWRQYSLDFKRLKLSLPPLPPGLSAKQRTGSVEFRISTLRRTKPRLGYCFQAELKTSH